MEEIRARARHAAAPTRAAPPARAEASDWLLDVPEGPRRPALWPSVAGLLIAGALLWLGRPWLAVAVFGAVIARSTLVFLAADTARRLDIRVAAAIGAVIAYAVLTPVWLLFLLPLGLATGRRRRMFQVTPAWHATEDAGPDHGRWS